MSWEYCYASYKALAVSTEDTVEYLRPSFPTEGLKTYISSTTEIQRPLGWGYYSSALQSLNLKMQVGALSSEQIVPFFQFF